MNLRKARGLTDFEKSLRDEIFERDKHIGNSIKYAIDEGKDYVVPKNSPQWQKTAIEDYKNAHRAIIRDDSGNEIGKISYEAQNAVNNGNLHDYIPQNDEEKSVFDYLKNKQNKVSEKQEATKQETTNKKDGFFSWLGKQANAGLSSFNKSIASTLDFVLPTEFLGKYDYISKINDYYSNSNEYYSSEAQKSSESRGEGWKTGGDIVIGTVAALPNAILAFMSGGASAAGSGAASLGTATSSASSTASMFGQAVKNMVKNPTYWTSAMQTLGTDYEEAKERGANDLVAAATAILTTALNAGIEVGGGIEQLPSNIKKGGKNALFNWVKSTFEEGGEEVLQGITTNAMAKLMYDHDAPILSTTDDKAVINPVNLAKEFGMGVAVGGILGGAQTAVASAVNTADIVKTGKYFKNADAVQTIIDTGLESPLGSESYKLASKYKAKGKNISDYEVGKLYYANLEQITSEEAQSGIDDETSDITPIKNVAATPKTPQNVSPTVEEADNMQTVQSTNAVPFSAAENAPSKTVSVGDTFKDTKTGNTVTVTERDAEKTVMQVNTGTKTETRVAKNSTADAFISSGQLEKIENNTVPDVTDITLTQIGDFYEAYGDEAVELSNKLNLTPTTKTVNGEKVQMVGFPVSSLENYKEILGNNYNVKIEDKPSVIKINEQASKAETFSPEKAQVYNILISNLKNKAESLGILDRTFFERLQNIENFYNPSVNDRVMISNEFHRVFAGNTDPLVTNWLKAIDNTLDNNNAAAVKAENTPKADGNISVNEDTTNIEKDVVEDENSVISNAINDTLFSKAKLDIINKAKKHSVKNGIEVFAKNLKKEYEQKGTIEKYSGYFKDGGEKVVTLMSNSTSNTAKDSNKNVKEEKKRKIIRAKKSDWASHDVYWYAPNSKTVVAYSTVSASDLIGIMADDNPKMTISEMYSAINYDTEAKKVLQAYINSGFGDSVASEFFSYQGRSFATEENADTISSTSETTDSKALGNTTLQDNDVVSSSVRNEAENGTISDVKEKSVYEILEELGLTYDEQRAILNYKSSESYVLNEALREEIPLNKRQLKFRDDLNSALDKITSYQGVVYRNIGFNDQESFDNFISEHKNKDIIKYPYFISASKVTDGYNVETDFTVHYEIESKSARDVEEYGATEEREVLFKTDTDYAIDEFIVSSNKINIKMRELSTNAESDRTDKEKGNEREIENRSSETRNKRLYEEIYNKNDIFREGSESNVDIYGEQSASNRGRNSDGVVEDSGRIERRDRDASLSEGVAVRLNQKKNAGKEDAKNDEPQSGVLARESKPDDRGLRTGASRSDAESGAKTIDEPHRNRSGEALSQSVIDNADGYTNGNDSKRAYGTDDADNAVSKVGGTSTTAGGRGGVLGGRNGTVSGMGGRSEQLVQSDDHEPEKIDTAVKSVEKKRPSNKGNFIITNDIAAEFDNTLPNAEDNIKAIETLLALENEGRAATAEEKKILAKYKGWGGIDIRYMPYELSRRFNELYGYEQRKAMQSSQNNAFFTPTKVIDAMYDGIKRMGFKGGNILETSMGIGNFFGRMPAVISNKSALTGIELESYTARIAQYLYPGATVINMPFQDVAIRNGSYDLVIGNVPFGQNKISYNKKKYSLHNYFIISSLDKVKDGGIVAVITSAGTLDSHSIDARKAIMDRADIVACYKLPEKVFSRNANTEVQTDLLILRKRKEGAKPVGDSILNTKTTADGLKLNEYFVKHPENILGKLAKGRNAWGDTVTVLDTGDFYDKLNTAMRKLPKGLFSGKVDLKPIETIVSVSDKPRFFEKNGKIYADDGAGTATQVTAKNERVVRDYINVRDAYKELLEAYGKDLSEEEIKPLRDTLSEAYDNFYKNNGAITGDGKKKIGTNKCKDNTFLEADADYYLVSGLESYDSKNSRFVKSALFEKDTLRKKKITNVDFASDALAVSLNESGKIDFNRMQELTGKTEKQLAEELKGEIVLTPEGDYVLTDIYLSGNIYEKLEAVKGKPEFKEQQAMLEKVIPAPKEASSITVKLGANYIDTSYVEQFAREVLGSNLTIRKDISGRWVIEGVRQARYGDVVNVKYGCNAFNAVQLLEKILNDGEITATKKVGTGSKAITVFDAEMTDIAKQKADDIREAFDAWIFSDSERRTEIVSKYNRTYNNYRPLDYERIAEKLSFDSMDSTLKAKLYPHQKKGISRFLFGGNVLFAHGVGTGKTFEMIASVMEAKRMGIVNKTAMVVPNNKVVDFKRDIMQAYPNAKVLVIDTANKKRQTMLGLVNSNDWDIVLIARTTFTKIPVSRELQAHYAAQQLEDLELQISMAENDKNISRRQYKGLIKQRDSFEQKLKDLNSDTKRDENSVEFEKLGIDCICVDEAHNYKSIMTPSKLDIKGLVNKNNAQIANDMLMKLDYIRSIDGRIIFGTGTPITNTVSEIYNMMRMVRPDVLEDAGIHSLDEWVNTFAKIESTTEIGIDNQIKTKSTQIIRSFVNVSEMVGMFRQFADIVFTEDVVKDLPKAVYKDIEIDGTEEHKRIQEQISETLAKTKKADLLKVHGKLMSMADAAAVDLKMLSGANSEYNILKDYSLDELEFENSKINTMCDIVMDEYKQSSDIKGTQIIFCDKGSGSGTVYSFNLHKDIMQKLIDRGIPSDQIVIVKNQSDAQLEALYDKVNAGEVRVLIGTSQKMAEGLNVQRRVVAIHHPTVTYKPSDWEQGNARGVRSGNINKEVRIYRYLQKNTFDSHKWQAQDRKGEMINKALRGDLISEMEDIGADEDGGAVVDAATAMAITSGNPLVKEKIDIDKEVVRLKTLKRNYMSEVYRYQDAIAKNPDLISKLTIRKDNLEKDIVLRNSYSEKAEMIIKGKNYTKQTEANKALTEAIKSAPKNGQYNNLGMYNGFDIMFKGDTGGMNYSLVLKGANEYLVDYAASGNNIARMSGVLNRLDAELKKVKARLDTLKTDLEFAKQEIKKPFEKEKDLTEALTKQKDVTYRYEHYGEKLGAAATAESENTDTAYSSRDIAENGDFIRIKNNEKYFRNIDDNDSSENRWTTERVNGAKDSNVNIADIVKDIMDKFDIPISTGKVTDREASGIYKERAETIRTRIANNLPTISHELGHHLNKKYAFDKLDSVKELRKAVSEDFLDKYPPNEKNGEAVAEFVRRYLKNTNEANRLCPDFYSDFVKALSKSDLKSVNEIASSVNEYLSYNISERYDKAIVSSQKKEKLSFRDKWHEIYSNWIDAFHPQKQVVDYIEDVTRKSLSGKNNAYILATNSLNAHSVANFLICEGFRDLDGNIINAKSFIDSIGMVRPNSVKLLDKYLVLRHSLEWINPNQDDVTAKRVFADDTLENVEEIEKQIAEIENTHPEIKIAAENLYEYQNNILKYFVIPAGGMTEDTLATLNRKYPSYVPFYRAVGKKSGFAKSTFANQRSPLMRAKGSGELIISPTESIIRNTEKMVKFAMRNQVMNIWADYADNVDGFGQFMEKVAPDMIPHFVDITSQKERFTDALQQVANSGENYFAISDLLDEVFGDAAIDFTPVANANKKIVTVMRNGKPSYYQIHNDAFYNSVAELSPGQSKGLLRVSQAIMQPMKLLITQNNPIFAATNALRDFATAYKLSPINNPVTFTALYIKALGGIISNSESYKQYKAMGGGHSSELSANIDSISKTLRKVAYKDMGIARRLAYSVFRNPIDILTAITEKVAAMNDVVESVPRFMEFQRTLNDGGDLQEAIYNADDITTNFKRRGKGAAAKALNSLIMFNNAAIQGVDKMFRTITEKDPKKRYKTLLKWMLHALLMGIVGYIYNREVDEEGYKNLSSYKKNNFYNFAIGDGDFISIPKPRENALLDTFTERTIEYFIGENKDAFYNFGEYLTSQLLPPMLPETLNPVDAIYDVGGSTVFGGLLDIGFNKDFKGTPIESKYDEYSPSNERYTENTSKIAYELGQTKLARNMEMSPKKIDHLISSYTGILGQVNKALFPINESRRDKTLGLRNKFISDSNYSTDLLNKAYDNTDKAKEQWQYDSNVDNAVEYEQNTVITSYISGMNKAIKALPEDEQRNGRIYLLKALNNWNYDDTSSQTEMLSRLDGETVDKNCIFDELPSSVLEWTVDKQKYTYQMTPQEYHEYITNYLTVVENSRRYYAGSSLESYEKAKQEAKDYMSKYKATVLKDKYLSKAQNTSK